MSRIGERLAAMVLRNHVAEGRLFELAGPDGTPVASAAEQAHLDRCARCRGLLVGYRRAESVLSGGWSDRPLRPGTRTAGLAGLDRVARVRVGRGGGGVARRAAVPMAMIAVLIGVVATAGLLTLRGGGGRPGPSLAGGSTARGTPHVTAQATTSAGPSAAADPYRVVTVTPGAAVAAVKAMVGLPQARLDGLSLAVPTIQTSDLVATGPFDGALGSYYKVIGHDVSASVDAHDGHVAQLLLLGLMSSFSSTWSITTAQAQAVASTFLTDRHIGTDGLTVSVVKKDRGPDVKTFVVSWQRVVNGATVPDSRMVEMDAGSGVVFNMDNSTRPYSDPPTPAVGRDQAVSYAEAVAGTSIATASGPVAGTSVTYTVVSTSLQVWFTPAGVQQLLWSVELSSDSGQGYKSYAWVSVDAMSGSATVVGRG